MPVKSEDLDKVLAIIKDKYGDDTVRRGDEEEELIRIPTGIIQLDSLIGGGFPMGRWVHLYGDFGSGKTLTAMHLIREAQQRGLSCIYYNLEKQYSKPWAESIGVDTSRLEVIEGSEIEKTGEKLDALLGVANIHIIDSVGAGAPMDELAARLDEWSMGLASRTWGKVIRRANTRLDRDDNMIVLINQERAVFGKSGGGKPTGGSQIEYASSLTLQFSKSNYLFRDKYGNLSPDGQKIDKETGRITPDGIDFVVSIKKSRVCDPYGSARLRLEFGTGGHFDEVWALGRLAIINGLIERSGSWYTLPGGERVQGESKVKEYIKNNPEFAQKLRELMING